MEKMKYLKKQSNILTNKILLPTLYKNNSGLMAKTKVRYINQKTVTN